MTKKITKKYNFPAELFIRHEEDDLFIHHEDGIDYFIADKTFNDAKDGEVIGRYALQEVIKKRITHDVEQLD